MQVPPQYHMDSGRPNANPPELLWQSSSRIPAYRMVVVNTDEGGAILNIEKCNSLDSMGKEIWLRIEKNQIPVELVILLAQKISGNSGLTIP